MPGRLSGPRPTVQDVFEAIGANAAGKISDHELLDIENAACPGAGACGGQFTANTMATVMELIGLSPMGTASVPQVDPRKNAVARRCGEMILNAVRAEPEAARYRDARRRLITPSRPWPRPAVPPMRCCICWRWRAKRALPLEIDDFQTVSERTPLLVDLKPAGRFVAVDVDKAGGIPVIAQRLMRGRVCGWHRDDSHGPHALPKKPRTPRRRPGRK